MKIAVMIPCYNEEKTIEKVIADFRESIPDAYIYVYDNNSTDSTARLASMVGAIVCKENSQGKGNVVHSMFRQIDADCYILVDGDDTYPAESAKEMVRLVSEQNVDMVIGDRLSSSYFQVNDSAFHSQGNRFVKNAVNFIFGSDLHDIMSGYRAYGRKFVKCTSVFSHGFEIETEITIKALYYRFNFAEIPVLYRKRPDGSESKLDTVSDGFKVISTIFKMFRYYKPLLFFNMCGMLLWFTAIGLFIPIGTEFYKTGLVPRFPTLIVIICIVIIGTLLMGIGGMLDVIDRKHRETYELIMNLHMK